MKQLAIDNTLCQGFGICEAVAPTLFRLDVNLLPNILKEIETPEDLKLAEGAVRRCPRKAIRLVEI